MADIDLLTRIIEPEAQALGFDLVRVRMIGGATNEANDSRALCRCEAAQYQSADVDLGKDQRHFLSGEHDIFIRGEQPVPALESLYCEQIMLVKFQPRL